MAVTEQTPIQSYSANGVATLFAFSFLVLASGDLVVQTKNDASGMVTTKTIGVDYSVSGIGSAAGGSVTFFLPPASGNTVVIYRDSELARSTDYQDNGDLLAETVNLDFDRLWLVLQEIFGGGKGVVNALRVPNGESIPALGNAAARANRVQAYDSLGNPILIAGVDASSATALALDLADMINLGKGDALVGVKQPWTGAVGRTLHAQLQDCVSVKDFGAVGDFATDDTAAIQAAIAAVPKNGRLYFPRGKYKISDELRITGPMLIVGDGPNHILEGFDTADNGSYVVQTNIAKMAFKLVAALQNYAFGQYGICGVHFQDLCIQGTDSANKIVACIGVDTTVNGGDFHIRGNSTTRCNLRYAVDTLNFTGIAYLNNFYQTNFLFGTRGVKIARGTASDSGGQTRFFGCLLEFCVDGASLNEDTVNGVFSFFGCTIGDNTGKGISTNDEVSIVASGTNFENNTTAGIYVLTPLGKANSNSSHFRHICGNEFFSNGCSIWFDKQATSASDGNFNYATRIDANSFADALAIKLTVPGGHPGFAMTNFVIGSSNTGLNNGGMAASQISAQFFGTDERRRRYSKRYVFTGAYVSGSVIDMLPIGLVVQSARMYLTANATGFSLFTLGDIAVSDRYVTIANAQTQALNTWVSWAPTVPQVVLDGTNNQFRLIGSGGILNAAGVIEVEGYVS
jgi:hypothetical protein